MAISASALAIASLVATVAGTGVAIAGQQQQEAAARSQANFQAAVARNNSLLARRAADDARARGKVEEQKARLATSQLQARQKAVLAGNNVLLDGQSPLLEDTALLGEFDVLTIRSNAEREALQLEAQGANFDSQAEAARLSSGGSGLGVAATALSGIGSVAQRWYGFNKEGLLSAPTTGTGFSALGRKPETSISGIFT